ncbi:MAG: hypothetical protein AB8F74_09750 [Saprospiraceae bacterium]
MKNLILLFALAFTCQSFVSADLEKQSFVNVFETPQIVEIDRCIFNRKDCNNKYYLPVPLPKNAKGFIYAITPTSNVVTLNSEPQTTLLQKVEKLAADYDAEKVPDFIMPQNNKQDFNFYLLQGKKNVESFNGCGYYEYIDKTITVNSKTSYVEKANEDTYFIGIENPKDLKRLRLKIEVVAVL